MAIVGVPGWIGASAVSETGERWMAAAGAKVGVGTPFWMSTLAGKSVGCKVSTVQYMRQAATVWGANTTATGEAAHGTITGANAVGLGATLAGIEVNTTSLVQNLCSINLVSGPKRNITVTYGGVSVTGQYLSDTGSVQYYFIGTGGNFNSFIALLKATGVLRDLKVT